MKISVSGKATTVIEFSKEELEGCRITYESISRNAVKSKTAIFTIISEAAKISGNEKIIDENTLIDILPDGEGGCVIILNNLQVVKDEPAGALLFSESVDCFFDLARSVKGFGASKFYKTSSGYAMYVEGEREKLRSCGEYAELFFCDELGLSRIDEYSELLIGENALEVLCGTASEK